MRLGEADVQRAAAFARLGLTAGAAAAIAAELAPVVAFLGALGDTKREPTGGAVGVGAGGMPLRADDGPPYDLARPAPDLAAGARAGFVLVPRLAGSDARDEHTGARAADWPFDDVLGDDALAADLELGT